ncbi:MAG: molybdenum cofactor guanylyltransferase [Nevskia sp.]|nr:molybdenum cofactor guanylyltransferase [Nevskia sp.]
MQPDAIKSDITAAILCGGAGDRLGGVDKPLRLMDGRTLIARVLERTVPQAAAALIVANRSREAYAAFGHAVVDDGRHAGKGPLAGIAAGLAAARTEWLLCVPGDAPLLPPDLAARLHRALVSKRADIAVVQDGAGRQPLCSLLPRDLLADLEDYLAGGGTAPRQWLTRHRVAEADFSDWPRWAWSANTPAEWRQAEHQLRALERREPNA